jgi:hypothetical protein
LNTYPDLSTTSNGSPRLLVLVCMCWPEPLTPNPKP